MNVDHKGLLIILDGLGDRPNAALNGRTPLQAAATPVLDQLVAEGQCGLVDPLFPGVPVDTHTGAAALMGISPRSLREFARGPVEAVGAGLELRPGDIAMRCNFATVAADKHGLRVVDRRAGRIREGTHELAAALTDVELGDGVTATVRPATHHRAVLRLRGPALAPHITDTDPGTIGGDRVLDCRPWGDDEASRTAADAVNEFVTLANRLLAAHPTNRRREADGLLPANGIVTRGAGVPMTVPSLPQRLQLSAAAVAGEKTILGLATLLGYAPLTDDRFTAMPDTDVAAKVELAMRALADHDLVVLHIKGPDVCSHDRDAIGKRDVIERIDAALAPLLRSDFVIGVSCDHSTNTQAGHHCGDPAPSILRAPHGRIDACRDYDELTCAAGGLGRLRATGFLSSLLDNMGPIPPFDPSFADFV